MVKKRILAVAAAITVLFTMMPQEGVVAEAAKKPVSTSKAASGSAIATSGSAIANSGSSIDAKPGKKKVDFNSFYKGANDFFRQLINMLILFYECKEFFIIICYLVSV